ncbi:hypothetical protein PUNSTDRAFT_45958 [Punctularia strigosozonata HHB-11173 SS5]|uniref:uncharacterized protein n=1 Tax=Punctularia strigosozonata (strain HHB-11173) TaxID=741275 RepID=UPI0004417B12|nr:uncharacterized protein PUNSTDRAFT_45958 [Punctularia strigosozonata HHB-11173 SS5]EIN06454.1 hypothetical protein PUNSTDRAFT_45958 [Punctularia strigosozonata HHB-11173 SS5]
MYVRWEAWPSMYIINTYDAVRVEQPAGRRRKTPSHGGAEELSSLSSLLVMGPGGQQLLLLVCMLLSGLDARGHGHSDESTRVRNNLRISPFSIRIMDILDATLEWHNSDHIVDRRLDELRAFQRCMSPSHASFIDHLLSGGGRWSENMDIFAGSTSTCRPVLPQDTLGPSSYRLCCALNGKSLLLVGPASSYRRHDQLLQTLVVHSNAESTPCPGSEFCTFHQVCQRIEGHSREDGRGGRGDKKQGSRVSVPPSAKELAESQSALIRYTLSDSLYAPDDTIIVNDPMFPDPRLVLPYVDPDTGVRVKETHWLFKARRADVIIISRGPVPAPSWTYDGTRRGNWTFVKALHLDSGRAGPTPSTLLELSRGAASNTEWLLYAALVATTRKWLPEVMDTLKSVEKRLIDPSKIIIWDSGCSRPESSKYYEPKTLAERIVEEDISDPWLVYQEHQGTIPFCCSYTLKDLLIFSVHANLLDVHACARFGLTWFPPTPCHPNRPEPQVEGFERLFEELLLTALAFRPW